MILMTTPSPSSRAADIEAIGRLVATVEHSQQTKDPEEFLGLFHPDAIWTTAHGKVLVGLDAISGFTRKVLPAATWDGRVTYEVVHVLFIRPDVAAVKVRQLYLSPGERSEGAPLYVMAKQPDGRWLLTACQNTGVVVGDA
ncbi:SgcJ/EcaC family oxidoreductase [Streptomyces sp. NPDC058401]|uniref:SgcJ/EcaC family oxidoreductase n=1 Tax=Streptomyces sp. NPDC058401 TaxID=3346480 RepID=UPI003664FA41